MYINSAQDEEDEDVFRIFSLAKQADEVLNPKLPKSPHRYLAVDFATPILSCCLMSMILMSMSAKSRSQQHKLSQHITLDKLWPAVRCFSQILGWLY